MLGNKQRAAISKHKIEILLKHSHFSRDLIPDIAKLMRLQPKNTINALIPKHLKVMDCIKWLILLHNLIFIQSKSRERDIEALIYQINPLSDSSNILQTILLQKMIIPYKAFLLKRNKFNLKEVDSQFHCFAIINILQSALSFTSILFTLGRYLLRKYHFLVEFNLIIAKDLGYLYKTLSLKMDEQFKNYNLQIIELLNEGMICIYYNCYFNKLVSHYAPHWINTDQNTIQSAFQIRSEAKITSKKLIKTEKEISIGKNHYQIQNDIISQGIEQISVNLKEPLKSASTIASIRQSERFQDPSLKKKWKEFQERRQFIQLAESLLQSSKGDQGTDI